jgi:hypothetical protein
MTWVAIAVLVNIAVPPADRDSRDEAQYRELAIGILDRTPASPETRAPGRTWEAFQLKDNRVIEPAAFFERVGRDDLAERERLRATAKRATRIGGWVVVAGGLAYAGIVQALDVPAANDGSRGLVTSPVPGLIAAGIGLLAVVASTAIGDESIDVAEAKRLERHYNARLRDGLGIP